MLFLEPKILSENTFKDFSAKMQLVPLLAFEAEDVNWDHSCLGLVSMTKGFFCCTDVFAIKNATTFDILIGAWKKIEHGGKRHFQNWGKLVLGERSLFIRNSMKWKTFSLKCDQKQNGHGYWNDIKDNFVEPPQRTLHAYTIYIYWLSFMIWFLDIFASNAEIEFFLFIREFWHESSFMNTITDFYPIFNMQSR